VGGGVDGGDAYVRRATAKLNRDLGGAGSEVENYQ
jgi:hypothetical protein